MSNQADTNEVDQSVRELFLPLDGSKFDPATHIRMRIEEIEKQLEQVPDSDRTQIPVKQYFAHGLYAREIVIPVGTLLTGRIHKFEHINVISKGEITVMTENGLERIKAPCTIISKPGTKRIGYAHEETVWTSFHAFEGDAGDADHMEQELAVKSHDEYLEFLTSQSLIEEIN